MTGSMADTVGRLNPMRYRGYYYDSETGYYYLQSRYYDPEIGRFINADASHILQLAKDQSGGMNLFAYCFNDPINSVDPTGYRAINITSRLLSFMRANARTFANYISQQIKRFGIALGNVLILNYFVNRVKTGGIWDLKRRPEWKLKNRYDYYVFMGRIITAEDIGNIHFGYVGRVFLPDTVLRAGADVYQIYSKTSDIRFWWSFFDDPRDSSMIRWGTSLYLIDKYCYFRYVYSIAKAGLYFVPRFRRI